MVTTARPRDITAVAPTDPLVVEHLTKTYANGVRAARGISFTVRDDEAFGLLGPNGAGKRTTLGILTTLVSPTGGRARVDGHDVARDPFAVRRVIGPSCRASRTTASTSQP